MARNHALALRARDLLCAALGVARRLPGRADRLHGVPSAAGRGSRARPARRSTTSAGRLVRARAASRAGSAPGPCPGGKLVRVSAQLYNHAAQYRRLAGLLREALAWPEPGRADPAASSRAWARSTPPWSWSAWSSASASSARRRWWPRPRGHARSRSSRPGCLGGLVSLWARSPTPRSARACPARAATTARWPRPTTRWLAFMLNWAQAVMQGAGAAGVAFIGAEYLLPLLLPAHARTTGALMLPRGAPLMLILLALNWAGIRTGARTQNVLSLSKIVMIAGLAVSAAPAGRAPAGGSRGRPARCRRPRRWPASHRRRWPCFYTYGGYQGAMNLARRRARPRRNLPLRDRGRHGRDRGRLYLADQPGLRARAGPAGVAASPLVAAALARATLGPVGEAVVSVAIFLSAAGFVNATILQMPRSYYAMAEDGALPARVPARGPADAGPARGPGLLRAHHAGARADAGLVRQAAQLRDVLGLAGAGGRGLHALRAAPPRSGEGRRLPHAGLSGAAGDLHGLPAGISLRVLVTETRISLIGLAILLAGIPLFLIGRKASGR